MMLKTFFFTWIRAIIRHNIGSLAAIIAFFGFSSLFPLLALLFLAASLIVPEATVEKFLSHVLQSYVPMLPSGSNFAISTIHQLTNYGTHFRLISIVGLLWGTIGGFVTLQRIIDTIYEVHRRRAFFLQYVIGFAMLGILLCLTITSSLLSLISPTFVEEFLPLSVGGAVTLLRVIGAITFPILLLITCYCCYRILPSRSARPIPPIVGAVVATIVIYISRYLFVIYTHFLGNYRMMYGTLTFIMLFVFWIYIACIILLVGAEISAALDKTLSEHARERSLPKEGTQNNPNAK